MTAQTLPNKRTPDKQKPLYSISEAAKLLRVSPKTLRRWEKRGLITSFRTNGNQRRYSLEELNRIKEPARHRKLKALRARGHPTPETPEKGFLSIGEAAKQLGVSTKTLRRWDKQGILSPIRTAGGQRRYTQESLDHIKERPAPPPRVGPSKVDLRRKPTSAKATAGRPPRRVRVWTLEEARAPFRPRYTLRKLAVIALAVVVATQLWFALPPLTKKRLERAFSPSPINPIVDVNDIFEYKIGKAGNWRIWAKYLLETDNLVAKTFNLLETGVFNTVQLVDTIFFGEGKRYFINRLGDAVLRAATFFERVTIKTGITAGAALKISFEKATQTGDLTGVEVDFSKITDPPSTLTRYGVHLKGSSEPTATDYGVYVEGTNWDYGIYSEDDVYIDGTLEVGDETTITGIILPGIDSTFDIGAVDREWANLYVDTLSAFGGTLSSLTVTGTSDLRGDVLDTTGNLTLNDTVDISGALNVTGAGTFSSTLDVGGATTLSSTLDVGGDTSIAGDLTVQGTTGGTFSGAGAGIDFSGTSNHLIQSSGGILQLGALTLTGTVTGNNQSITGLNNVTGVTSTWSTSVTSPLHTGTGAVTLSSGGTSALTLDSDSGNIVMNDDLFFEKGTYDLTLAVTAPTGASRTLTVPTLGADGNLAAYSGTLAAGDLLYGATTNVMGRLTIGSANQVLGVAGAGGSLEYKTVSGAANEIDITNAAGSITIGIIDPLALSKGGTSKALTASNGGIVYTDSDSMEVLAGTATAGQILRSGASSAPSWSTATYPATASSAGTILRADGTNWVASTATYPNTTTINQLLYSSAANTIAGLATANSGVLVTSSTGVPSILGSMTNGQLVVGSTGATPVLATLTGTANEIDITNGAGSITIGIIDPLILSKGGTGANLTAVQGGVVYSGASALAISAAGTSGYALISGGTGAPTWTNTPSWSTLALSSTGNALTLSGAGANIAFAGAGLAQITTAASQDLALMPGGNVGIGTTGPGSLLELSGGHIVSYWSGGNPLLRLGDDSSNYMQFQYDSTGDYGSIAVLDGGVLGDLVLANGGGNVGIGVPSPSEKLDVAGTVLIGGVGTWSSSSNALALFGGTPADYRIGFDNVGGTRGYIRHNIVSGSQVDTWGHIFSTSDDSTPDTAIDIMFISASGNVGIGTTGPGSKLTVTGAVSSQWTIEASGGTHGVYGDGSTWAAYFVGPGYLSGAAWVYGSDIRMKENISNLGGGLDKILQLNPVQFDFINGQKNQLGFIAQDVQSVIPEAVSVVDENTGMLGLKIDFIIPYLVNAIKELDQRTAGIETLGQGDVIINTGNVGIGTTDPAGYRLKVAGTVRASGGFSTGDGMFIENLDETTDYIRGMINLDILGTGEHNLTIRDWKAVRIESPLLIGGQSLEEYLKTLMNAEEEILVDAEGDLAQETSDGTMEKIIAQEVEAEMGIFQRLTAKIGEFVSIVANSIKTAVLEVTDTLTAKLIRTERLEADEILLDGKALADTSTGEAAIEAGEAVVLIEDPEVTPESKIFLTPLDPTGGQPLFISKKEEELFEVSIDTPLEHEIRFDYWIVN